MNEMNLKKAFFFADFKRGWTLVLFMSNIWVKNGSFKDFHDEYVEKLSNHTHDHVLKELNAYANLVEVKPVDISSYFNLVAHNLIIAHHYTDTSD